MYRKARLQYGRLLGADEIRRGGKGETEKERQKRRGRKVGFQSKRSQKKKTGYKVPVSESRQEGLRQNKVFMQDIVKG